jgi:hypothetical protein
MPFCQLPVGIPISANLSIEARFDSSGRFDGLLSIHLLLN